MSTAEIAAGCAADELSMTPLFLGGERETPLTKLFVSDLPATATSECLRAALETFGELDEVVVKHTNGVYRQGAHFGFVWTSKDVALKIMSQTHVVAGQRIPAPVLAKRQQRLVGKEPKASADPRCPPDKIFVGGLSNETRVDEFRAHFASYGAVKDATIMLDRLTNRSRGFGFVIFEDPASVAAVLDAQYHEINGRKVEVKPALPKELMLEGDEPEGPTMLQYPVDYTKPFPPGFQGGYMGGPPPPGFYPGGEYGAAYPEGGMVMMPPGGTHYYAVGVQAPQVALSPAMPMPAYVHAPAGPPVVEMPVTPHGVPIASGPGYPPAHKFVMLPPAAGPAVVYPPSMAMYPPMMQGTPVGGPVMSRGAVYFPPPPNHQQGSALPTDQSPPESPQMPIA